MKERPILFSGAMVRAILDGRKTQTRRVVAPRPPDDCIRAEECHHALDCFPNDWHFFKASPSTLCHWHIDCPYGKPVDRLWVRETFTPDGVNAKAAADLGRQPVHYRADGEAPGDLKVRWRSAIHMPRWASRITLEVERVRVERVQDISEEDAIAEGVEPIGGDPNYGTNRYSVRVPGGWLNFPTAKLAFQSLWDSINAKKHPWSSNPWVWCVSFRRVES